MCHKCDERCEVLGAIGWGIVGGESGHGARGFDLHWACNIVRQFKSAGIPLFVRQVGGNPYQSANGMNVGYKPGELRRKKIIVDSKGGNPAEWPEPLRVREFPRTAAQAAKGT